MAYKANALIYGGLLPIASFDTLDSRLLGMRIQASDPDRGYGEFIYLKGVASTAVGSWVVFYPDDWTTVLADSGDTTKGDLAVAMSANIVATTGGWYQIYGKASGLCLASFADNGDVYLTTTNGSVDDAVVDGYLVHKARGASDRDTTTGLADFEIAYPYADGIAGND